MAAVPIYVIGTITTAAPKAGEVDPSGIKQCVIHGLATIEGLSVGGGPIIPPATPPSGAHPEHPIYYPPGSLPHPEHPIVLPPDQPPGETPPPIDSNWKWAWNPAQGWHPAFVPESGKPQPPAV